MDQNWLQAFKKTEGFEGWHKFSNDPADPGGATYDGVIQKTYDAFRRLKGLPPQSVKLMTDADCASIMKNQYWLAANCQDIFSGLDVLIYDISVNCGPSRAIKMLQQALGLTTDGIFGLQTLAAVRDCTDQQALIRKVTANRMSWWKSLTTFWRFGKGWTSRGNVDLAFALEIWKAGTPA